MPLVETARFPSAIATETDMQNWKNYIAGTAVPTLAANITATATSFSLTAGTGQYLPADNFTITIDSEIMFVTTRTTDTLTIGTRGYEGTTAAAHSSGAQVVQLVTAKSHNQIVSEIYAIENALGVNLANVVKTSTLGVSVATLTGGKVPLSQMDTTVVTTALGNAANGYAKLDGSSKIATSVLTFGTTANTICAGNDSRITGAEQTANKNQVNGYAGLDSTGNISEDQVDYAVKAVNDSAVTVATSTTSDQTLMTYAAAAGILNAAARCWRITGAGSLSTTASTQTITFKLNFAAGTVVSVPFAAPASLSGASWWLEAFISCMTTGTTGTVTAAMRVILDGATSGSAQNQCTTVASATFDLTIALTLTTAIAFSVASTSNTCTQRLLIVERMGA